MEPTNTITVNWRLNADAVRRVRAAAALKGMGVQEYVSECLNRCAAAAGLPSDIHREDPAPSESTP